MKIFIILLSIISFDVLAEVTLEDCQQDALSYASPKNPVTPLTECTDLIKAFPGHVNVISSDGRWKAYGTGNMVYLDSLDAGGNLLERSLLAGPESELVSVQKVFLDTIQKRVLIIQLKNGKYELLIQDMEFFGNTSPLKVMRSESFNGATSVKFLNADEIEFVNGSGTFGINADAESRDWLSTKKPLTITPK